MNENKKSGREVSKEGGGKKGGGEGKGIPRE